MDEAVEVHHETLVDALYLAVRLWVVCRAHGQCGLGKAKELTPEHTGEYAIMATDDVCWEPMKSVYIVQECLSHLLCIERM